MCSQQYLGAVLLSLCRLFQLLVFTVASAIAIYGLQDHVRAVVATSCIYCLGLWAYHRLRRYL